MKLLINNILEKTSVFFSAKNICGKNIAFAAIFAAVLFTSTLPLAAQTNSAKAVPSAKSGGTQEQAAQAENADRPATDTQAASAGKSSKSYSFFVTAGPMLMVNTSSSTDSAPSPVMFSCGFGATLFQDRMFQFQPRLSFFTNYYLWNNDMALPAEVENRTATALSFMFDLPATYTWQNGKNEFQAGAGLGFLARIGILSNGVSGSDENRDDSTRDATQDVKDINSWFWSDMRFLYPELCGSWTYTTPSGWKVGAEARLYLPLGSLITGRGLDATIISLAAKINTK